MLYEAREAERRDQLSWMKSAENKGEARGEAKGEAKGMAKTICQFLEARFGAESQELQETIRMITDLDILSRITNQIFIVAHLDEATALIQGNLGSQ